MAIITRSHALRLIRDGKASIEGCVLDNNTSTTPTHVVVSRYDLQRVDHYVYTKADAKFMRDPEA
jgi:hypothetical protein